MIKKNFLVVFLLLVVTNTLAAYKADTPLGMSLKLSPKIEDLTDKPATGANVNRTERVTKDSINLDQQQELINNLPPVRQILLPTEFQRLVESTTGNLLPIYGQQMFDVPFNFTPLKNVAVTADYVVGPGDEVVIKAWGQIDIDYSVEVDRNGMLSIPKIGSINVSGVKYEQLQGLIKAYISKIYNNFDLTVTLGQLRSFQVYVTGQVKSPGAFTINPMSTLVNAVYLSGGPSATGSLRRIQLKRGTKIITEFDFYDLLLKGDKSKDFRVQSGDVIYVLPVGAQAAVSGSVNAPGIFEAKEGESLSDLIAWAGGFASTAQTDKLTLQRKLGDKGREVQDVDLKAGGMLTMLKNGDIATIYATSPQLKNSVTLRGNIDEPKHFSWKQGLRIHDLIPDHEALITKDYWINKNTTMRHDLDNGEAQRVDVKKSLAEINWDYAVVERLNREDLTTSLIPFNLGKAIIANDPEHDLLLQTGDVVTVFSKKDMPVPLAKQNIYIRLEGEFNNGGIYKVQPGETLRQVVTRIGGITTNAYLLGLEFKRESLRVAQQKQMDAAITKAESQLALSSGLSSTNVITPEDAIGLKAKAEQQKAYLEKLREIKATGRLVLDLSENSTIADLPNTVLENGDVITMPTISSTISVIGEVYSPNSFTYNQGYKVSDYLASAGGATENGDKSSAYVVRVSGITISNRSGSFMQISSLGGRPALPGDTIVMPQLLEKTSWMKNFKDISQIFYQFGLGAAAIKVLKN